MKGIIALVLLVASSQAIDFTKLKPMTVSPPVINPRYTGAYWNHILRNQVIAPTVYPGYKPGYKAQSESAGKVIAHHESRIVGGQVASHGQFPWQALISMDNSYVCGGSLISEEWILTAGHCADDFSSFIVILGAQKSTASSEAGRIIVSTNKKIVHEGYDSYNINNDISLLKLPNQVQLSQYINLALLPSHSMASNDLVGEMVTVSGWGKPSDSSSGISEELRYVSMPVMTNAKCAETYGDVITSSKICTDTTGGHSSCNGDSGGPLVFQQNDGRYVEVGIVSFGAADGCEVGYPAAFTRVTSFLQWIETNTGIIISQ